jgi:hypothetical protein
LFSYLFLNEEFRNKKEPSTRHVFDIDSVEDIVTDPRGRVPLLQAFIRDMVTNKAKEYMVMGMIKVGGEDQATPVQFLGYKVTFTRIEAEKSSFDTTVHTKYENVLNDRTKLDISTFLCKLFSLFLPVEEVSLLKEKGDALLEISYKIGIKNGQDAQICPDAGDTNIWACGKVINAVTKPDRQTFMKQYEELVARAVGPKAAGVGAESPPPGNSPAAGPLVGALPSAPKAAGVGAESPPPGNSPAAGPLVGALPSAPKAAGVGAESPPPGNPSFSTMYSGSTPTYRGTNSETPSRVAHASQRIFAPPGGQPSPITQTQSQSQFTQSQDDATNPSSGQEELHFDENDNPYSADVAEEFLETIVLREVRKFAKDPHCVLVEAPKKLKALRVFAIGSMMFGYDAEHEAMKPEVLMRRLFVAPAPPSDAYCRVCNHYFHSYQTYAVHDAARRHTGICSTRSTLEESALNAFTSSCFLIAKGQLDVLVKVFTDPPDLPFEKLDILNPSALPGSLIIRNDRLKASSTISSGAKRPLLTPAERFLDQLAFLHHYDRSFREGKGFEAYVPVQFRRGYSCFVKYPFCKAPLFWESEPSKRKFAEYYEEKASKVIIRRTPVQHRDLRTHQEAFPHNGYPSPPRKAQRDGSVFTHALLLGDGSTGNVVQAAPDKPANPPPNMQQTPRDAFFQSNNVLNEVEMELIWLGEESMYRLVCPEFQYDYVYEYASPALKAELRKLSRDVQSEAEIVKQVVRMEDWLVSRHFDFTRKDIRMNYF